jgi:hypothetical protein
MDKNNTKKYNNKKIERAFLFKKENLERKINLFYLCTFIEAFNGRTDGRRGTGEILYKPTKSK